jgi:hypothetical protein
MKEKEQAIFHRLLAHLADSKQAFPWPDHICAQVGHMQVVLGGMMKRGMIQKYEHLKNLVGGEDAENDEMIIAAFDLAALAIRFIENLQRPEQKEKVPAQKLL